LRDRPEVPALAARLYEIGKDGVDPARGMAFNALRDDLTIRDAKARTCLRPSG